MLNFIHVGKCDTSFLSLAEFGCVQLSKKSVKEKFFENISRGHTIHHTQVKIEFQIRISKNQLVVYPLKIYF